MSEPHNLSSEQVLAIVQQRFPREYEIAVQQAYIANLESALSDKGEEPTEPDD